MNGYPQTIATRHLMAQPADPSARDTRRLVPASIRASIALFAVVAAFLLVTGAGFAQGSSQGHGNDGLQARPCTSSQPHCWSKP